MNASRGLIAFIALAAGLAVAVPARADGPHGHYHGGAHGYRYGPSIGLYYGGPYWWGGGYYPPPYYAYPPYYGYPPYSYVPPVAVTPPGPPVYIERDPGPAAAQPSEPAPGAQWWYLCASPRGAYPYVRECPGGWERVPAVPPGKVR